MESDPELEDYAEMLYEAKIQSKTLHRLILEPVNGKRLSRDYPLPADVLVVDECSMMDIDLADRLFSILDPRRTRLILLGDKDQLSAVGRALCSRTFRTDAGRSPPGSAPLRRATASR